MTPVNRTLAFSLQLRSPPAVGSEENTGGRWGGAVSGPSPIAGSQPVLLSPSVAVLIYSSLLILCLIQPPFGLYSQIIVLVLFIE